MWEELPDFFSQSNWQETSLVLVIFLAQAIFLRYVLKRHRLLLRDHFLSIFFYLFIAVYSVEQFAISWQLLAPFVIIGILLIIIQLYNSESTTNSLLALGSLQGVLLIIDPAFIWFLPFMILALSYFVVLDFKEVMIILYYAFLTIFLGYGFMYINDSSLFENYAFSLRMDRLNELINNRIHATLYLAFSAFALLFVLLRTQSLHMRSVKVRNIHRIFSLAVPFLIGFYFFSRLNDWNDFVYLAIPFAAVFAYYFENARNKWVYESIFIVILFIQTLAHSTELLAY